MCMNKTPNYIDKMSRGELVDFLTGFVEAVEQDKWCSTEEDRGFLCLHKKILAELSQQRVYKVSNIDANDIAYGGVKEYDTKYFASLKAAKRELSKRFKRQRKHPFVAAPDEVQELGVDSGINSSLVQSVITNEDMRLRAPGRFKFYEVRMLQDNQIVPVQFVLTSIDVASAATVTLTKSKRKIDSAYPRQPGRES